MSSKTTRAILKGKLGNMAIRIIDSSRGTNWSGEKAMQMDPEFLSHLKGIDPSKVLFVTGTNGKSSINNLINHILKCSGYKVVSNLAGANLITGVATSMVRAATISGKVKADYYVFETDERYLYSIAEQLPCSNLLITNIMKDQVQRNGDPDFIYRKIARVVRDNDMRLFLNADEPRACSMADSGRETVFYGVDKHAQSFNKNFSFVTMPCPRCHSRMIFDYFNNDGVGSYRCSRCGFSNAGGGETDYRAENIDLDNGTFTICGVPFTMPYNQPYMVYNYAAAAAACKELAGVSLEDSAKAIKSFKLIDGRVETINYAGKSIKYRRFKQEAPETLQNFINVITADPEEKVAVIGLGTVDDIDPYYINSFYAFDCDCSALADSNVKKYIFFTDTIAFDAANSFIYGGVDPEKIEILATDNVKEVLHRIARLDCDNVYLVTKLHFFEEMREAAKKGGRKGA